MATKVWETIIPSEEQKWLLEKNTSFSLPALVDLGYLNWAQKDQLSKALKAFRKDCLKEKLLSKQEIPRHSESLSLQEEQLLKNMLALEGNVPVYQLPAQGSLTLSVRLLHYRLHLLGVYPLAKIGEPFSPLSLQALHQLGQYLRLPGDSPELLLQTGHLLRLIHHLHQKGGLDTQVVAFKFSTAQLPTDLRKEVKEERGRKENLDQLHKTEKDCEQELEELENQILEQEVAERKRLENRNRNKDKRAKRISSLLRKVNRDFKKKFQAQLKEESRQKAVIRKLQNSIDQKRVLLQGMEDDLEKADQWPLSEAKKKEKKKALKTQIKARKAILKQEEKTAKKLDRQLKKLIVQHQKATSKQQEKLKKLQTRLKNLRKKINGLRFRFKGQLQRSLSPDFYKEVQQEIFSKEKSPRLAKIAKDTYNLFLIRIIQLHQWSNAYYNGYLDSKFAGKTFGALADMTEDLPHLRLKYILAALGKKNQGYWLLNVQYLLEHFCFYHPLGHSPQDASSPEQQIILETYRKSFATGTSDVYHKKTQKIRAAEQRQRQKAMKRSKIPRRIYHGRPTLLHSIGRVIGRLGKILWKGLKATFQILKNFVRMLYEDVRQSVVLFVQSLDFLLGKRKSLPLGENNPWDTPKYQYDQSLSVEENTAAAKVYFETHAEDANLPAKSINRTLKILRQVATFAIGLATGGLTWPALLSKLILFCRRWFFRWLKEVFLHRRKELFAL